MSQHLNSVEKSPRLTDLPVLKIILMKLSAGFQMIKTQTSIKSISEDKLAILKAKPTKEKKLSLMFSQEMYKVQLSFHPISPSCLKTIIIRILISHFPPPCLQCLSQGQQQLLKPTSPPQKLHLMPQAPLVVPLALLSRSLGVKARVTPVGLASTI